MKKYLLKRDLSKVKYLFLGVMIIFISVAFLGALLTRFIESFNIYYDSNIFTLFLIVLMYIIGFVVGLIAALFIPYVFYTLYQNDKNEASIIMIKRDNYRFLIYQRTILVTVWLIITLLLSYFVFDLINIQVYDDFDLLDIPLYAYSYVFNVGLGIIMMSLIIVNLLLTKTNRFVITVSSVLVALMIIIFNFVMLPSGWYVPIGVEVYLIGNAIFFISAFICYLIAVELLLMNINKRLEL